MAKNKDAKDTKKVIAAMAVLVSAALGLLTFFFVRDVKTQLWEQSVESIMESTRQGCNTLKIQLDSDFVTMDAVADKIKGISMDRIGQLETVMDSYSLIEDGVGLYVADGSEIPGNAPRDAGVENALMDTTLERGIIEPHISSVTGVNVFNLFVKADMADGTEVYLVKEHEIGAIVDSFSLSFYNDAGFSYVVNSQGDVLIRPPHPNSNKTVQNLFDMLPETENDPVILAQFARYLEASGTGWAVFSYQGEPTVFCYTPLELQSNWYLISIIPEKVVNAQTNEILTRSFILIGSIIAGIALLVFLYIWYAARTNRKLRNQAEYIGHLYNAIPDAIALISAETPHRLLQLNQEGLRLMGYPEGSSNDAPGGKLVQEVVYEEDCRTVEDLIHRLSQNGEKAILENRMIKKDGSVMWVAGIVEKTLDEEGRPIFIAAYHDITKERLAKEAMEREKLQERLTLVGAISNAYPVIISINLTKDSLKFIYVKPGLMLGLGKQKTYSELFNGVASTLHPEYTDEFKARFSPENLRAVLGRQKNEVFLDARQMLFDGNYHWTSTQIIYVDNPYSDDRLAILISRRIDEQKYEEDQQRQALQSALDNAKAASEAKGQFLSNMSHDIRTPMNAIVGMTAIAAAHLDDKERIAECLKKISLSSKHLLSLINDVLDVSKIESGKLSLGEEPFNFAQLAMESVELVQSQAKEKEIKMDVRLAILKNEQVIGDPLRIRQIFVNILSNAVKYTPEGGSILIEIKQTESSHRGYQSYVFSCQDTGIGMSTEFLERLFQPFERARDSTASRIAGTGLGMAITKNLTDLMNGEILVESKQGQGSVFTVILPLQPQETQQEEAPEEWAGIHSMIVDDDRQSCENAAELLTDMGLRAEFVTEGAAAVELVIQAKDTPDPYQLVIIDWKMPDMDGVEAARQIRREIGPDILLIVLTAYDWSEIETEARAAGVSAFMSKPFYRSKICYLLKELSGQSKEPETAPLKAKQDFTGRRLLLVEDNEINREIAQTLLEELGMQIEEACDGQEAVDKVSGSEEGYYDLILMDIQMPKMDGYEATRTIRSLDRRDIKTLPIIAMTANAFEEDVRAALRAGMNAHLSKPMEIETLEHCLYNYLSGQNG